MSTTTCRRPFLLFLLDLLLSKSTSQQLRHMASHGHDLKHQHHKQENARGAPSVLLPPAASREWVLDEAAGHWCPISAGDGTRKPVFVTYANKRSKNLCRWLRSVAYHRVEAPVLVLGWEEKEFLVTPTPPRNGAYFLNTKIHAMAAFANRCLLSSTAQRTDFASALLVFSDNDAVFNRGLRSAADLFHTPAVPQGDLPGAGIEESSAVLFSAEQHCATCGFRGRKYAHNLMNEKGTYRAFNSGGYVGKPGPLRQVIAHGLAAGCEESKAFYKVGSSQVPEASWAAKFRKGGGVPALVESAPLFTLPQDQQPPCLFTMNDQSLLGWLVAKKRFPRGVRMTMDREARIFQCMAGTEPHRYMQWVNGSLINKKPLGWTKPLLVHFNGPSAKAGRVTHGYMRGFTMDDTSRQMKHAFNRRCPLPLDWGATKEERKQVTMAAKLETGPACTQENLQAHVDTFLQKHLLILGLNGTRVPVRYSDICGLA